MIVSKRTVHVLALTALALHAPAARAQDRGAVLLGELSRGAGVSARVLVIGAHPDDEDTQLITWLARGRGVETAYLSLTRGDGGQNLIGNELGEALGLIRTEELLAARRLDGGRQYFARAFDFGFSKTAEETYRHWPHDSLLADVVTVVRAFRPHVIVSVFSGTPRDGHGHHQVAGLLAAEAFDGSADTTRYPSRRFGAPWSAAKFYYGARFSPSDATLTFNVGEFSPLRGRSYAELAAESRSQHKSQAFGSLQRKGASPDYLRRARAPATAPADPRSERSMFEGIDTSWTRFRPDVAADPGARSALDSLPDAFRRLANAEVFTSPASVLPEVARAQRLLAALCSPAKAARCGASGDLDRAVEVSRLRLARLALEAAGVAIEATADRELLALGDTLPVRTTIFNRGTGAVDVTGIVVREERNGRPVPDGTPAAGPARVEPGASREFGLVARASHRTEPWWLTSPRIGDLFSPAIQGIAEDERASPLAVEVTVALDGGARASVSVPVEYRYADPVRGEVAHPVAGAPEISVTLAHPSAYLPVGRSVDRGIRVTVRSAASVAREVAVTLALPAGLQADSLTRVVAVPARGVRELDFHVRGRLPAGLHVIRAHATVAGVRFDSGYTLVAYDHIRPRRLYRAAEMALHAVDVTIPPRTSIAYIPGVGDNVAESLRQLGMPVTVVDPSALATTDLKKYSAVVIGPRAYEAHADLLAQNARILAYAREGGTVVAQYGQYEMMRPGVLPYGITLTRPADRVTIEEAPIRVLAPDSPLLRFPNRIGVADFSGWVQERAIYMPREFAPEWTPLLGLHDPGEPENRGALLVAPVGRGLYVYVTLALFRQLPAAVPGAARLIVNLLTASQAPASPVP